MNETEITRTITDWLSTLPGCWWMKIHGHIGRGGSQKVGVPDLYIVINGTTIWVEVKRPGGKLKPSQEREIPKMQAAGARVLIVSSLEGLKKELNND